ncbi:hypothetical protein ACFL3G_04115 [Planctomycetota bacterium]
MDNIDGSNSGARTPDEEPISFGDTPIEPIPFDDSDNAGDSKVSHSPLNLGGNSTAEFSVPSLKAKPIKKAKEKLASSDRITGIKTFFTKLHVGSIDFLDEQINNWLKANPDVVIKHTNATTGMLVGKKTEHNIIITVWY